MEEDAVEIDLGSIGRRIGGLFGSKSGKQKEEPHSDKPSSHDAGQDINPEEKTDEEKLKEGIPQKKSEERNAPEKKVETAASDEDYFEIDIGRLWGRKKQESEVSQKAERVQERALDEKKNDGLEENEGVSEQKQVQEKEEGTSEEKQAETKKGPDGTTKPEESALPAAEPEKTAEHKEEEDGSIEIDFGKLFRRGGGHEKKHAMDEHRKKTQHPKKEQELREAHSQQTSTEAMPKEHVTDEKKETQAEKDEGTPSQVQESTSKENQADNESIEIDLGRLFGKGKKGQRTAPEKEPALQANEPEKTAEHKEEEDGSIEIDFGKLFRRNNHTAKEGGHKKKAHPPKKEQDAQDSLERKDTEHTKAVDGTKKDSDTVEIDLGKIGSSLSGLLGGDSSKKELKKQKKEDKEEEDYLRTVELDIDSVGKSIIHHRKMVVFVLLAAIISFSLYVRLLSAGSPLSPDYDTYLHYRYARDMLSNGMELPDWDEKSYYPPGRSRAVAGGYPLMEVYLYKFLLLLDPNITLINSAMVLTALFGGLATIPAFFIGKDASGELGGLFSAFLVGTIPAILVRSVGSYADTDAMVLFFSLLIVALYMKAIEAAKEKFSLKVVAYALSAAVATIILTYTWGATFDYLMQLLVPLPFLLLVIHTLSGTGDLQKRLNASFIRTRYVFLATFILFVLPYFVSGVFNPDVTGHYTLRPLSWGLNGAENAISTTVQRYVSPLSVAMFKSESGGVGGAGKNVYISVAEMQPPALENYTSQFGIVLYLALAFFIAGSSLLLYRFVPEKKYGQLTFGLFIALIIAGIMITRLDVMTPEVRGFLAKFFAVFGSLFFMAGVMRSSNALGKIAGVFFETDIQQRALLIVLTWGGGLFFVSTLGIRFLMLLGPPLCIAAGVFLDRLIKSSSVIHKRFSVAVFALAMVLLAVLFAPSAYSVGSSARGSMDPQWHDMLVWIKLNSAPDATVTTWWDPGHWVTSIADRRSGADGAHHPGGPKPISARIHDFGWSFTTTNETESIDALQFYLGNASEMYYISSNDLIGKFVWLSYFSTGTKQQYIILGESGSYPQNGATLHMYPMSQNVAIVVRESGDELEPWLYMNNNKLRIKDIVYFDQNGRTVKQSSKDGEDALVWMQGDKKLIVYMPGSVKDNILTRTYFFGGEGLEKFKLEFANQEIKLYQVKF